jgi:hypothetical protein
VIENGKSAERTEEELDLLIPAAPCLCFSEWAQLPKSAPARRAFLHARP